MNTSTLRSAFTALVLGVASAAACADTWTTVPVEADGDFTIVYDLAKEADTLRQRAEAFARSENPTVPHQLGA